MKILEDKVAIITGAASGIGRATALLFAKEGAKVIVSDIDEAKGHEAVEAIEKDGGTAFFIKADTSSPEAVEHLVKQTVAKYGALHIAVNNAGIGGTQEPVADYPIEDWKKVLDINLSGVFYGVKYQIPAMKKSGSGSIINMASILGQVGFGGSVGYVAAKHAVVGLTKTAAIDHAKDNIRVNAVGPGFIYTGLVNEESMGKEGIQGLESKHPIGRLGKPEEVAEMCLFLASDKSSFSTGDYYPVDGGYLAV
ncbi:NAD(P)-dependent dehydrogenase (short-subunit alcohol dehydrogenase family) [Gelidibacter algens]|uniref:NAD(P)-dependent dehydrogenase (Short-subunit alcohol dehydrogenase family) n=1 Tax=Gelidibacter algens TaxID=49280 RepID=A0A1A7R2E4_9FLAO|nr:SDR family oxidoreductase [Gelidibacter algens]OBX24947.1 short-chain dehydrogenase [Gelidibacter algens]RAJ24781.1 NAD(P)-dependent dehydrogenase (short-subunit alcohol dehydrogenase family) [Gelidibacter algens]